MWSRSGKDSDNDMPLIDSTLPSSPSSSGSSSPLDIIPEKRIPQPPALSRQVCLADNKSLTNFLKLSRQNVDDNLKTRLNSIINHHESSRKRSILPFQKPARDSESPCLPLIRDLLFPQWSERVKGIEYCLKEGQTMSNEVKTEESVQLTDEERDKLLRINPYGLRELQTNIRNKSDQAQGILNKYKNEEMVEELHV
ncbi:unnamed protein product [Ambrosiozyma monospora]|uniref:Unnamed protein product n=1 Tax=Ambrosiozyma monospora TaxID=43982 RepID=A0ACB5TMW0_AMBMO|nr:unnamed protein product [Ambrosiozyma monospora]